MMFAFLAIPLVLVSGGTVDYVRAVVARSEMQDALDATALMLSKSPSNITQAQVNTQASAYFNVNFVNTDAQGVALTPNYSASTAKVTVGGTATINNYFLGLIGIKTLPLSASSTVTWGNTRLRVALVLDNTGSMADDGKIAALRTATTNLLAQLKAAASQNGDVYVSIIPFVRDVNASAFNNASTIRWDDGTDNSWDGSNGTCSKSGNNVRSDCLADGTCSKSTYTTKNTCQNAGKTWTPATWTHANHNTWTGCVTDRDQNYDTTNATPTTATTGTLFPADWYSGYDINTSSDSCPQAMSGLSYDWTTMNTLVSNMQPNGSTNQAIGLQWGWQSLTAAPFTVPAFDPNYQYSQAIILLTDGLNTQDRWYGNGSNVSTQVDTREQTLCENVRLAKITLYTVQVNTGGDPTSTLLKNCASNNGIYDQGNFFLLTSASQIVTTFQAIGTQLSDLRIAK